MKLIDQGEYIILKAADNDDFNDLEVLVGEDNTIYIKTDISHMEENDEETVLCGYDIGFSFDEIEALYNFVQSLKNKPIYDCLKHDYSEPDMD